MISDETILKIIELMCHFRADDGLTGKDTILETEAEMIKQVRDIIWEGLTQPSQEFKDMREKYKQDWLIDHDTEESK